MPYCKPTVDIHAAHLPVDVNAAQLTVYINGEPDGLCGNQSYRRELLKIGIMVPEACWA